ncbi:MAG: galactitol-1-phosphate 5-dehydrogenase [Spirochaetota bacterium]
MKALVLSENGKLVVEQRPRPEPTSAEPLLLRVAFAGVCGSDLPRAYEGGAYHYPLVMGHEFSGTIEAAPKTSAWSPGDRVVVYPLLPDPNDPINQIGEYAVSTGYDYYGSRRDGAFQEYLTVPEFNVFRVPRHLGLREAAMTEPAAVAYHAAARPPVVPGMSAAVIGGGPIGLMTAQWLRLRGCSPVVVSEIDAKKLAIAADLGLVTVDASDDPVAAVRDLTAGGADVVVEACGLPVTFAQAIDAAGLFGHVVFLGNIHGTFSLGEKAFSSILRRELTIHGTWNSRITPRGSDEWTRVLAALERELRVSPLISHTPDLEDGAQTLQAMHDGSEWHNKVVFRVNADLRPEAQS